MTTPVLPLKRCYKKDTSVTNYQDNYLTMTTQLSVFVMKICCLSNYFRYVTISTANTGTADLAKRQHIGSGPGTYRGSGSALRYTK